MYDLNDLYVILKYNLKNDDNIKKLWSNFLIISQYINIAHFKTLNILSF
jgi:hypothetical protein